MSVKLQKALHTFIDKIINIEDMNLSDREVTTLKEEIIGEAADHLFHFKKNELTAVENDLLKKRTLSTNIDSETIKMIDYGLRIINDALEKRKKSYRNPDHQVSTNVLTHGAVLWVGEKNKKDQCKQRIITVKENNGNKLTYQNDRGRFLSMYDTKVFLALHKIWELKGKQKEFRFTEYELLQQLGGGASGREYNMVKESLENLFNTSVIMQAFYIKQKNKKILTQKFHLVQSQGKLEHTSENDVVYSCEHIIQFSDYLHLSLIEGYVSYISLAMVDDLRGLAAQALYITLCGDQLTAEGCFQYGIAELAERIGLSAELPLKKHKQTLKKAFEELISTEILHNYIFIKDNDAVRLYPTDWFKSVVVSSGTVLSDGDSSELPTLLEQVIYDQSLLPL